MNAEKTNQTMLVLVTGTIVLFFIFKLKWLLIIGIVLGFIGMFMPRPSRTIAIYWFKLAELIGAVVSKVLLSLMFILFLLPIAFLSRLFRPDLLQIKPKKEGSYYVVRNYLYTAESIKKPW